MSTYVERPGRGTAFLGVNFGEGMGTARRRRTERTLAAVEGSD